METVRRPEDLAIDGERFRKRTSHDSDDRRLCGTLGNRLPSTRFRLCRAWGSCRRRKSDFQTRAADQFAILFAPTGCRNHWPHSEPERTAASMTWRSSQCGARRTLSPDGVLLRFRAAVRSRRWDRTFGRRWRQINWAALPVDVDLSEAPKVPLSLQKGACADVYRSSGNSA